MNDLTNALLSGKGFDRNSTVPAQLRRVLFVKHRKGMDAITPVEVVAAELSRSTWLSDGDTLRLGDLAGRDAANADAALVLVVIQVRYQQLQRRAGPHHRRRHLHRADGTSAEAF